MGKGPIYSRSYLFASFFNCCRESDFFAPRIDLRGGFNGPNKRNAFLLPGDESIKKSGANQFRGSGYLLRLRLYHQTIEVPNPR